MTTHADNFYIQHSPQRRRPTAISTTPIEDRNLQARELAILTYLISKPHDWKTRPVEVADRFKCHRQTIDKSIRKLIKLGYMKSTKLRTAGGKWAGAVYHVHDEPIYLADNEKIPEKLYTYQEKSPYTKKPYTAKTKVSNYLDIYIQDQSDFIKSGESDLDIYKARVRDSICLESEKSNVTDNAFTDSANEVASPLFEKEEGRGDLPPPLVEPSTKGGDNLYPSLESSSSSKKHDAAPEWLTVALESYKQTHRNSRLHLMAEALSHQEEKENNSPSSKNPLCFITPYGEKELVEHLHTKLEGLITATEILEHIHKYGPAVTQANVNLVCEKGIGQKNNPAAFLQASLRGNWANGEKTTPWEDLGHSRGNLNADYSISSKPKREVRNSSQNHGNICNQDDYEKLKAECSWPIERNKKMFCNLDDKKRKLLMGLVVQKWHCLPDHCKIMNLDMLSSEFSESALFSGVSEICNTLRFEKKWDKRLSTNSVGKGMNSL